MQPGDKGTLSMQQCNNAPPLTTVTQDNIATIRHATLMQKPPCECAIVVSRVQRGKGVDARVIVAGTRARSCCRLRSKSLAFSPAPAEASCDNEIRGVS
jgi:hypothetical protein